MSFISKLAQEFSDIFPFVRNYLICFALFFFLILRSDTYQTVNLSLLFYFIYVTEIKYVYLSYFSVKGL